MKSGAASDQGKRPPSSSGVGRLRMNSVRVRLTAWNVAVLGLILIGFATMLASQMRADLTQTTDAELRTRVRVEKENFFFFRHFALENPEVLLPPPPSVQKRRQDADRRSTMLTPDGALSAKATDAERLSYFRRCRLFDPLGKRLLKVGTQPLIAAAPFDRKGFMDALQGHEVFTDVTILGQPVRVFSAPVMEEGDLLGVAQAARPVADQQQILAGQFRTVLTLMPVALLVAALGGIFLAERALRPVRQMNQQAAQISAEDLSQRLKVTGGDEMAELASTFNAMIGRVEESFRETAAAYERLERLYEQQQRFTADASHELRTPLARIKAHSSLSLSRERTGPEYRQTIQTVDAAADVMQRIVDDLLLLARSDAGQLELRTQPVPVGELLSKSAALARSGATVRVEAVDPTLAVNGDPHHLSRLMGNLVDNALRHTPESGSVTLAAVRQGDRAVLTVTDTGEGIPEEHLPHVCERFYRVDSARARRQGGTGLGLSICQSIVHLHGGTLELRSKAGEGTTAVITLPAQSLEPPGDEWTETKVLPAVRSREKVGVA